MTDTLMNRVYQLAKERPDAVAAVFKKETMTYRELYGSAAGIADILRENGAKPGDRICFSAISKPETIAVYLGVQLAGCTAFFLDKNSTAENMAAVYRTSGAVLLVTDKPMKEYGDGCRLLSLREIYAAAREAAGIAAEKNVPGAASEVARPESDAGASDSARERVSGQSEACVSCGLPKPPVPQPEAPAEILFTTGTTGKPKGVILSYRAVYHILKNTMDGIGIRDDDVVLIPLPLNHSFALRVLRAVLYAGATAVLQNGFTFAKEVENNITALHCTGMACVPASYEVMKTQMQGALAGILGKLRYIEFGAGSLTIRQRREITELLPDTVIFNTWGSSESGGAIFCNVTEAVKSEATVDALGKPLDGRVEVRILDPDGREIESDEAHPGRMTLRGEMTMSGYWENPEATAEALRDSWLLTGDLAYLKDGYVFMLGRADDIINVGGEKVSPIEVENTAGQFPEVRECACIGAEDPDGILGQIPVLFLVAGTGYREEELKKFLTGKLERYKLPGRYMLLEAIPRNRMQKVDRKELRRLWENRDALELMTPVISAILSRHSVRKFEERKIPEAVLDLILRTGYHAPSGHNMQSWRFTVLESQETIARLREAAKTAAEANHVNFYGWENPQALILVSNDKRNADGCQDASCAAENMMLAAHSLGLGAVWLNPLMTLRDAAPVKEVLDGLGVPENHTVWCTLALGYPAAPGAALAKKTTVVSYPDRNR